MTHSARNAPAATVRPAGAGTAGRAYCGVPEQRLKQIITIDAVLADKGTTYAHSDSNESDIKAETLVEREGSIPRGSQLSDNPRGRLASWMNGLRPAANPKHESGPRHLVWLCFAIAAVVELWLSAAIAHADPFDLPSDFNILDADGTQVIGHGHYEITPDSGGYATISGEDRFDNGEYDVERDKLELRGDDQIPRMVNFEHTFYKANGTLQRVNRANFEAGFASCIQYESGKPVVHSAAMQFPPDTFAGAAIVIRLKLDLQGGRVGRIVLHDFSCIPGPKVLKVEAYPRSPAEWRLFPGELVRVDIKADFGWLNFVTALFAPQIHAWFSPSDDWRFVGGKFTRFYKGPEIILALSPKTNHNETRLRQGPNLTSLAQRADAPERRKLSATSVVESTEELGWINSITDVANSIKSVANSPDLNVLF